MEVSDFPVNAVIVSFLPYDYNPYLPGMIPTFFHIPKAERDDFVVVPITDCMSHIYVGEGRSLATMHSGVQVASAIARDHIAASIHTVADIAFPGIKSVPGNHSKEKIQEMFPEELIALNQAQKNWFGELVKYADDTWMDPNARGKHRSISDIQRYAAKYLGLNKEWITTVATNNIQCYACTYNVPSEAAICPNCKTVLKSDLLAARQAEMLKKFEEGKAEK